MLSLPCEPEQLLAVIAAPHLSQVPRATESPPAEALPPCPVAPAVPVAVSRGPSLQLCVTTVLSVLATVSPGEQGLRLPLAWRALPGAWVLRQDFCSYGG